MGGLAISRVRRESLDDFRLDGRAALGEETFEDTAGETLAGLLRFEFTEGAFFGLFPGLGKTGSIQDHHLLGASVDLEFTLEGGEVVLHAARVHLHAEVFVLSLEGINLGLHLTELFGFDLEFVTEMPLEALVFPFRLLMREDRENAEEKTKDKAPEEPMRDDRFQCFHEIPSIRGVSDFVNR